MVQRGWQLQGCAENSRIFSPRIHEWHGNDRPPDAEHGQEEIPHRKRVPQVPWRRGPSPGCSSHEIGRGTSATPASRFCCTRRLGAYLETPNRRQQRRWGLCIDSPRPEASHQVPTELWRRERDWTHPLVQRPAVEVRALGDPRHGLRYPPI